MADDTGKSQPGQPCEGFEERLAGFGQLRLHDMDSMQD